EYRLAVRDQRADDGRQRQRRHLVGRRQRRPDPDHHARRVSLGEPQIPTEWRPWGLGSPPRRDHSPSATRPEEPRGTDGIPRARPGPMTLGYTPTRFFRPHGTEAGHSASPRRGHGATLSPTLLFR